MLMSARMVLSISSLVSTILLSTAFAEGPSRIPAAVAPPSRAPSTQITPAATGVPAANDVAATAPEARNSQSERLKTALMDVKPQLGHLEPWQEQIYTEEAAPQAQRF